MKFLRWEPSCSMRNDGRTDGQTDRHTDITMQIVVFRNFANTPESWFPSLRGLLTVSGVIHNTRDIS